MSYPTVTDATQRLYDRLPEFYRSADEQDGNYPFLRYISAITDRFGETIELADRIDYVTPGDGGDPGDTSDLVNPLTADAAWLPWLAQLVGVELPPALTVPERRDAVLYASAGWRAGTKTGMADAAKSALTGTQYVKIIDHYTGDPWLVEVRTKPSETPDTDDVLAAIISKRAKPAGVQLIATDYEASWDTIEAELPTWTDIEAAGSWIEIEEVGEP